MDPRTYPLNNFGWKRLERHDREPQYCVIWWIFLSVDEYRSEGLDMMVRRLTEALRSPGSCTDFWRTDCTELYGARDIDNFCCSAVISSRLSSLVLQYCTKLMVSLQLKFRLSELVRNPVHQISSALSSDHRYLVIKYIVMELPCQQTWQSIL